MTIRKAIPADIPGVAAIYEKIIAGDGGRYTGWKSGVYPTEQTAAEALEKGELYVMEEDGCVIAAAKINKAQEEDYVRADWAFKVPDEAVMVLHTLVVDPDQSGKGCAKAFVAYYEYLARKNGCWVLRMDTNVINTPARTLYGKLGFREAGEVDCTFNGITGVRLVCLEKSLI